MGIDVTESFGFEESGISFQDSDGVVSLYITSGTGSPVGFSAPVPTLYTDENGDTWKKFGLLNNQWKKVPTDEFIDKIYASDLTVPVNKVAFIHDASFTTGNLIIEGCTVVL